MLCCLHLFSLDLDERCRRWLAEIAKGRDEEETRSERERSKSELGRESERKCEIEWKSNEGWTVEYRKHNSTNPIRFFYFIVLWRIVFCCIVSIHLYSASAVHTNQKRFQCERPKEKTRWGH